MDHFKMPKFLFRCCETLPKTVNLILLTMGFCNFCLVLSVFQAKILPNLGISPSFLAFLLCAQNSLTWLALNNHRIPHLPTLIPDEFVIGCLVGISVGGSITSFILSQFFGRMSSCKSIEIEKYTYQCNNERAMINIWFWSGLVFWLDAFLCVSLVFARDELVCLQQQSYENVGLTLDELQNQFQRNFCSESSGDGTFFGKSSEQHEAVGDAQFPSTPSQEIAVGTPMNYGAETGFDNRKVEDTVYK